MAAGTSFAQNKTKTDGDGYAVPKQETASNVMLQVTMVLEVSTLVYRLVPREPRFPRMDSW